MNMANVRSAYVKVLSLAVLFFVSLSCGAGGVPEPVLVIKPKVVTANDVITISFPRNRPKKMSIRSPSNEWYVVHEKSEKIYLLPKNNSSKITSVQKKVSEINGVKWDDGKRVVEPVFSAPGEYLFYMADNLETEPENTFHLMRTVTYRK